MNYYKRGVPPVNNDTAEQVITVDEALAEVMTDDIPAEQAEPEKKTKKQKKPKKEKEFRRVKTISPMAMIVPYIMKNRCGAMNMISDRVNVAKMDRYIKEKQAQGFRNMTYMHIIIAAYVRLVSQRPALNRFIRGQRIYTRRNVEVALTIKKEMSLDSPDTVVKVLIPPDATIDDVYNTLDRVVTEYRANPGGDFDNTAKVLYYVPGLLLTFAIDTLRAMDYFGLIPSFLTGVSPFHCSYFITSMGSLGIPSIFHHLYDFGTCPVFCAFGTKQRVNAVDLDGNVTQEKYIDLSFVLDERICDGYYFASALKMLKNILKNPQVLDNPPAEVIPDIP